MDETEKIRLVHTVSNVAEGVFYVCNCCGLCVTGCKFHVARLERKSEEEIINPPKDYATWEHERLVNRGLTSSS